jgi:hypothetical protein
MVFDWISPTLVAWLTREIGHNGRLLRNLFLANRDDNAVERNPKVTSMDPVPSVTESDASGRTRQIFAEIRETLNVDVVNLVWRHLATMPGALEWVWESLKPLIRNADLDPAARQAGRRALNRYLPSRRER